MMFVRLLRASCAPNQACAPGILSTVVPKRTCVKQLSQKYLTRGSIARNAYVDRDSVEKCIARWMERAAGSADCIQRGLHEFLRNAIRAEYVWGFVGLSSSAEARSARYRAFSEIVLCAQDPAIDRFKPDSRGLMN